MVNSRRCLCVRDHTLGEIRTRTLRKVHLYYGRKRKTLHLPGQSRKKCANNCHFDKVTDGDWRDGSEE